jgi:hypothetical protein
VRYVLIGGQAAILHGSPLTTEDVDITPQGDAENLLRLAGALTELEARIRVTSEPEGPHVDGISSCGESTGGCVATRPRRSHPPRSSSRPSAS